MVKPLTNEHAVPFDGTFQVGDRATAPDEGEEVRKDWPEELAVHVQALGELQRRLFAENRHAVLVIFQGMDAAGKDSAIRATFKSVSPVGLHAYSFKRPSDLELGHDFLWRTAVGLPERGSIGVFNRSYYEEVLIVRVHPELLEAQRLPDGPTGEEFWEERIASIRNHERHLAGNGTLIVKFWLNVSLEVQRQRLLSRLDQPEKRWKASAKDAEERRHWKAYMHAYGRALNGTSRPWAPWYAIPADDKPFMKLAVARTLRESIEGLEPRYPGIEEARRPDLDRMRKDLESEL